MSLQVRNPSTGLLERVAGFNDTDTILSPTSSNPISNKSVYAALAQKIDKTVNDLINYYTKSQTYSQEEVRALIGAISTLTIEVVTQLPTQDISTTTIYFVGPTSGKYDEYVYVNNAWVQIGDTTLDLSNYLQISDFQIAIADYYTQTEINNLLDDYYDKDAVDSLLDTKQDTLTFDNQPIAGSSNVVTSAGIKSAIDNILITGNGGSIIKVHHTAGAAAQGNIVTASKGTYSVSSSFDSSGDAILIGFGEIGDVTITCTNGSETGAAMLNIPCFSNYSVNIAYGLDYKSWLIAGGVDPFYYDSLDEVLEDEEVVRRLMTIHASVDYLASITKADDEMAVAVLNNDICAKWINLRDYALDTLYANTYTKTIMDEADKYGYGEWAIVPLSQPMTDNTHPVGALSYYNFPGFSGQYKDILYKGVNHYPSSSESLSQLIASQPWGAKSTADSYIVYTFPKKSRPVRLSYCTIASTAMSSVINVDHSISIYGVLNGNETLLREESIVVNTETQDPSYIFSFDLEPDKEYDGIKLVFHGSNSFRPVSSFRDYNTLINYFVVYEWGPKGNVPIMTSNTAPYGEAFADSNGQYSAGIYAAFNGDGTSSWLSNHQVSGGNSATGFIGYKSTNPICVKRILLNEIAPIQYINDSIQLYGSNDGSIYEAIGEAITNSGWGYFDFEDNDKYYLYHKVSITQHYYTSVNAMLPAITTLQFYGREMKVSVPVMTSNTAPYGEVSAGTYHPNYDPYKAFNNDAVGWHTHNSETDHTKYWIQYSFTTEMIIKELSFRIVNATTQQHTGSIVLKGSNNGTNFTDVQTIVASGWNVADFATAQYFSITNNNAYKIYRFEFVNDTNYNFNGGVKLQFYGFDYSERDWDTEHPMKYIYDHGVELEEISDNNTGFDWGSSYHAIAPTKRIEDIELIGASNNFPMVVTSNTVDCANYTYLFMVRPQYTSVNNRNINFGIASTKTIGSSLVAEINANNVIDALNINSASSSYYIYAQNSWNSSNCYITEIWLQ